MTTKEQLIKLVIGNEFITKPRLQKLYLTLLDRLETQSKQLAIRSSCEQLKDKNKTGFIGCEDATKKDSVVLHNVDFSGKCFKCGKQVWERQDKD